MDLSRKIIHCDCDCFYASIEMRDNPSLLGRPIAVGGSPKRRGVIATCNYEARKFGIHSAMASATARVRCPNLIIVRPDMEKYREASRDIHEIFQTYTNIIEPLSLDEAFLDVSNCQLHHGSATLIAQDIREKIKASIGITISAGIAPNKFLAKIASDWNKPDGQFAITPAEITAFVEKLPVKKLYGVGKVTNAKMNKLGIKTCGDLRRLKKSKLQRYFGSHGERLYQLSLGIDDRQVKTERIRKSVSVENTYNIDLEDLSVCVNQIPELIVLLEQRLKKITPDYSIIKQFVKIKFHDFVQTTVEMTSSSANIENFKKLCKEGYARHEKPVRLLGVGLRLSPITSDKTGALASDQLSLIPKQTSNQEI